MPDKDKPEITVLMPAYNAAAYIREAIESVLAQTYTAFEFLIVNDGSTDDTENIIRSYNDERIVLHNQANTGVIGALNKGLELAQGKYIARFDADDVCYPDRLQVQLDFMKEHPDYVLIGSASDFIDKDGNFLFKWEPDAFEHNDLEKIAYEVCPFDHPTVMYKREVAVSLNGYPKGAIHFEDHIFWTLFFTKGKMCNMHTALIKHRFNPESVTIDEKWRGPVFRDIKYKSIRQGYVTPEDETMLRSLLKKQDFGKYKEAAYYSMIGKKFLWNQYRPKDARRNLKQAILAQPGKPEPYLLYVFSFLPKSLINYIYNRSKK